MNGYGMRNTFKNLTNARIETKCVYLLAAIRTAQSVKLTTVQSSSIQIYSAHTHCTIHIRFSFPLLWMEQNIESNFAISLISRNKTTSAPCTTEFKQQNTEYCYIEPQRAVSIGTEWGGDEIEIERDCVLCMCRLLASLALFKCAACTPYCVCLCALVCVPENVGSVLVVCACHCTCAVRVMIVCSENFMSITL